MNYGWQETMKILIPGFYGVTSVCVVYVLTHFRLDTAMCENISKLSALLMVGFFFIAFFIGFINEIISGELEFFLYKMGLPRPSNLVLNSTFKRFSIVRIDDLRRKLGLSLNEVVDNRESAVALAKAKQSINMETCQEFYYQSILARNLCCSHTFSSVFIYCIFDWSYVLLGVSLLIFMLLYWYWRKMNLVYVKRIFTEYVQQ